jgi:hypothetical protein
MNTAARNTATNATTVEAVAHHHREDEIDWGFYKRSQTRIASDH